MKISIERSLEILMWLIAVALLGLFIYLGGVIDYASDDSYRAIDKMAQNDEETLISLIGCIITGSMAIYMNYKNNQG